MAGARTTVTSLWKVDDDATRKLMGRFYANYWKENKGTLESLRFAQLEMLTKGVGRGMTKLEEGPPDPRPKRTPPYYWAAFVLAGDWR
jgi:CHAT domain-containing protein